MREVDVLVCGLGPAGAAAALAAADTGLSVLAIDRKAVVGEPVQCAEFVPMPLLARVQAGGVLVQAVSGMTTVLPSGVREDTAFPGLMINRARFDQAIAGAAQARGAQISTRTWLRGLDVSARAATLEDDRGRQTVRYRVLIAADGPRSTTAALLGWPVLDHVCTRQYTVPLLAAPYEHTDIWLSDEFPGGYGWLFPKGPVANLGIGAGRAWLTDLKRPLERLRAALVATGRIGSDVLSRTGGDIPVGGLRPALCYQGIVFAGDAAGLTHPITGAGIAAAVVSGERAGLAARAHVAGDVDAFASYEEDVRDQFEDSLIRALAKRRFLDQHWRRPEAGEDAIQREGWIAFPEYFVGRAAHSSPMPLSL